MINPDNYRDNHRYFCASREIIAEEIEDPFGGDENDLPTNILARNIQLHVAEII